jgi:hypothetical protein
MPVRARAAASASICALPLALRAKARAQLLALGSDACTDPWARALRDAHAW